MVTGAVCAAVVALSAGPEAGGVCCCACALFFRQGPNWITATNARAVASAPAPNHSHRLLDFGGVSTVGIAAAATAAAGGSITGAGFPIGIVAVLPEPPAAKGTAIPRLCRTLPSAAPNAWAVWNR